MVLHAFGELFAPDRNRGAIARAAEPPQRGRRRTRCDFERAQRTHHRGLTRQELPVEVGADLLFSNVRVNVEGDDAGGYRVQLRAAARRRPSTWCRKTARTAFSPWRR